MKALLCGKFGPVDELTVEEVEAPALASGQMRVEVKTAALNFPDLLCVRGEYQFKPDLPFVPGAEGAGIVTELGEGVTGFAAGDRVAFNNAIGAFAEQNVVPASAAQKIPDSMPFEHAAGFTVVYATSYYALKQCAQLKPGETLLVLGAAGGVGLAAVELGKTMGARVIAACSSAEKLKAAKDHGADDGIDYTQEDLKQRVKELTDGAGANVIYDPVGGKYAEAAFRSIAWQGRYLVVGFAAGDIPKLPLNLPLLKGASIVGVFLGGWLARNPKAHLENLKELYRLYEAGKIHPHIAQQFSLDEAVAAFAELSERCAIGKVLLMP